MTLEYETDNLAEALAMRYPAVWVASVDPVDCIDHVRKYTSNYKELDFYLFNAVDGLQKYNYLRNRYDTVHIEVRDMMGELAHVPIMELPHALKHLYANQNATIVIPNAEQYENNFNDMITFINLSWNSGWERNSGSFIPLQIILTSKTNPTPPEGVSSAFKVINHGLPSASELKSIAIHIHEANDSKESIDFEEAAESAKGLTKFEAIQLFHSMYARTGKIDLKQLEDIKFRRIASRSNLQIIRPRFNLDEVAGAENIKKSLETSLWLKENPEEKANYGITREIHKFLLLGPAGTGKSMLCEAASSFLGYNMVRTGLTHQLSKFHGESEQNTLAMFEVIKSLDPICVWADELGRDISGGQSSHVTDGGTTSRTHGVFLTGMQELSPSTYFFAAANDISTLAPEMLRADRFDKIFFVGFPTYEHRVHILTGLLKDRDHTVEIDKIAQCTGSFTGAELVAMITSASMNAMHDREKIDTKHALAAAHSDKNRIWLRHRADIINSYKVAYDQHEWSSDSQREEASTYINGKIPQPNIAAIGIKKPTVTATARLT